MSGTMKKLLIVLGVLVVVGAVEYAKSDALKTIKWEIQRQKMNREAKLHMGEPFLLPMAKGPENAKVKVVMFINTRNNCQRDKVNATAKMFEPFTDRVRVAFRDMSAPRAQQDLVGYPVGCSMTSMINGLMDIKVPWAKRPLLLQGPVGENMKPGDWTKLLDWALTPEGLKSLAEQRAKFEPERARRAKIDEAKAKKAKATAESRPASGSAPKAPASGPPSEPMPTGGK